MTFNWPLKGRGREEIDIMTRRSARPRIQRSLWQMFAVAILVVVSGSEAAHAKGGASISVTTTASLAGSVVSGTVTISNSSSQATTVTAVTGALEVRYASGTCVSLPPGTISGSCRAATFSIPAPGAIPPSGSVSIPYSVDTCSTQVSRYSGAKDMRTLAVATAG